MPAAAIPLLSGKTCTANLRTFQDFPARVRAEFAASVKLVYLIKRALPSVERDRRGSRPQRRASWYRACSIGRRSGRHVFYSTRSLTLQSFSGSSIQLRRSSPPSSRLIGRRGLETVFYAKEKGRASRGPFFLAAYRFSGTRLHRGSRARFVQSVRHLVQSVALPPSECRLP